MIIGSRWWKWFWMAGGIISILLGIAFWGINLHSVAGPNSKIMVQFQPLGGGFILAGVAEIALAASSDSAFAAVCGFVATLLWGYAMVFGR